MKWCSSLATTHSDFSCTKALESIYQNVDRELGQTPDLLIAFVSAQLAHFYEEIANGLQKSLEPKSFIGCSAGGLIGGGVEIEGEGGLAVAAALLPDVKVVPFHVENNQLPGPDEPPSKWEELVGVGSAQEPFFVLLPDPYSFSVETFIQGLDYAFPGTAKIGGLASGAASPSASGLILNGKILKQGLVGVAIAGNIVLDTVVAQGCRPIGKKLKITKCDHSILYELDGRPALIVLKELIENLNEVERVLARNSLFFGVAMNEFKSDLKAGDFLIRNIIGIEPKSGALVIGEMLRAGRTVQFHVRDAATSSEDLRLMLKNYVEGMGPPIQAQGALLFSCLGRGTHLYGTHNHDTLRFMDYLGQIPLSGFFCNGEIGPIGGTTFIHGYTSSFGIFKEKARIDKPA